jgi:hypothetical protein
MKIADFFRTQYTRPLNALNVVSIAELAKFTNFNPKSSVTPVAAAWDTLQGEWSWEYMMSDLEYLDFKSLRMFFKDGSSLTLTER